MVSVPTSTCFNCVAWDQFGESGEYPDGLIAVGLFDGTLGTFQTAPVNLEIKPNEGPIHAKPFQIPKIHKQTLQKEVDWLCKIGVLKKCSDSLWASPTFIIPKKQGTMRFVSDFRKLNAKLV